MLNKNTGYWVASGLFCAVYAFSSFMDLSGVGPAKATMEHLGFPSFVDAILGVWKAGAVVALLAPRLPRLKEWAYAGILFDLSGGFISHLAAGDAMPKPIVPVVLLAIALTSYFLRPASRTLQAPALDATARAKPALA